MRAEDAAALAPPRRDGPSHGRELLPLRRRPAPPSRVRVCAGEQLVELKSGETYNGNLEKCDNWMNLNLREVICTSRVREHAIALSRAAPIAQLSFSRGRG